ncbi:volume-regulated anion channel subunit LRRC8C [Callorhinchus milii]|uniref:volume-regulated anion channel subunit LRRC8C n=1 Tax=Callorhinchus milii TaxID=7868 RepID=UPI000457425D|nr:volume-regulated anion channel subunit LRRC8C [Callorhinchus milii]|eukprot:gi/632983234/ref/XP_007908547.1/ PREDICTED: leucine-rich repeat-containing protein 8C-like [Callorhinchus milii]
MIPVTELSYFGEQDPAFKILKPWWDVFAEYLTLLMVMVSMFGGALQVSNERILCIPVSQGVSLQDRQSNQSVSDGMRPSAFTAGGFKSGLDIQQYYLINQWCYDHSVIWFSKYFPYLVLLHSMIFLISSNFWFKFPGTSSKIEHFITVLGKCLDSPWTTRALSETVYEESSPRISTVAASNVDQSVSSIHTPLRAESSLVSLSQEIAFSNEVPSRDEASLLSRSSSQLLKSSAGGLMMMVDTSAVKILDKKEGEQAKSLFEKVKKFRLHTEEEGDILYKMYLKQTVVRAVQSAIILIYISVFIPRMGNVIHCVDSLHITGFTDFFCIHGLWRMFRMLSLVYITAILLYSGTCVYTLHWILYYKLRQYSFENVRVETGMDDIPDVRNDFAFLLHLIDQYDKLYARKFAVFLSDVSENKLLQLNLNHEWSLERLKQRLVVNRENQVEMHLFMMPGIPFQVYDLTEIEVLKLELIKGITISAAIANLKTLREMWLYNCSVKVERQALLFLRENVSTLRVRFGIADEIPPWIFTLRSLRELYIEGHLQTDSKVSTALQMFSELPNINTLHLKTNVTKLPTAILDMAARLQRLIIHNEGVKITSLANIKKLFYLTLLRLLHCNLERIPSAVFSLTNLQELDLKDNNLNSTEELASCQHLRKLTCLKLWHNNVPSIPVHIAKVTSLEMLHLNKNKIEVLPPALFKLTKLLFLDLSHNNISRIPPEIGELTELQHFAIECNKVNKIPETLSSCVKLRALIISYNRLTHLPPSIGLLRHLQLLDLKCNKLDKLPVELGQCVHLRRSQLIIEEDIFKTLPPEIREQFTNPS